MKPSFTPVRTLPAELYVITEFTTFNNPVGTFMFLNHSSMMAWMIERVPQVFLHRYSEKAIEDEGTTVLDFRVHQDTLSKFFRMSQTFARPQFLYWEDTSNYPIDPTPASRHPMWIVSRVFPPRINPHSHPHHIVSNIDDTINETNEIKSE